MSELSIHPEGEQEADKASEHYEVEQPGLGLQFIERGHEQLKQAVWFPGTGTPAVGYSKRNVRKFHFE